MDLSRQEYPAMLASLQPSQAVAVLSDRVKHVSTLNSDIADWLQERRRVEEVYVQGLRKLARKQPPDESSDLGIFSTPWQRIVSATDSLADSHQLLAQKIEADVEKPLRDFARSSRDMQAMSTIQGNLSAMAREIEAAQKKVEKLQDKGAKASVDRVSSATSEVENATSQWESQAPYVFEKLQQVDESRLNHLRDVLTQFQTHEVDQVERNRVTAEQCLNALLNVETADEIKTFSMRITQGRQRPNTARRTGTSSSTSAPAAVPDDVASQRSGSVGQDQRRSGLKGLRRFGTVLKGRRQSAQTLPEERSPERTPEKRPNLGSSFTSFGGRGSRSRGAPAPLESTPSATSTPRAPTERPPSADSRPPRIPNPLRESYQSSDRVPNGLPAVASAPSNTAPIEGSSPAQAPQLQQPLIPASSSTAPAEPERNPEKLLPLPSWSDPISQAEREAAEVGDGAGQQFKLDIREAPIAEEIGDNETAMANVANTLRAQAAPSRKAGTLRGRRDVRNTVFVPSSSTPELTENEFPYSVGAPTSGIAPASTFNVPAGAPSPGILPPASPFVMPAAAPGPGMPPSASPFALPAAAPSPGMPPLASPFAPTAAAVTSAPYSPSKPGQRFFQNDEQPASDAGSIRSMSSSVSMPNKHPDMHRPGLNSSVVEVSSAWFENGQLTRAVVTGELALVYNSSSTSAAFGTESIRLENFNVLEKVAPNPAFITQQPDRAGEYTVNLAGINRTAVAFKYQVHIDDSTLATHAPIILTPAWKVEPTQTSAIFSYSRNPSFNADAQQPISLINVVMIIHLEGAKAVSCQSKPVGAFVKERSVIYWRLGEITLEPNQMPQKLLARFTTESEAKPGSVEAKWEINSENMRRFGSGLGVSTLVESSAEGAGAGADPFADDGAGASSTRLAEWKDVESVRRLVSGTYVAS